MANRFSIESVFKAIDKVTKPVTRIQNNVLKATRKMKRGFTKLNNAADKFKSGLKKVAIGAAAGLVIMGSAMANVIDTGADFGRAIGSAAAKFPDDIQRGTAAFRELEEAARDVGRTTEFTSTDAAKGLNFLAKAGFNAKFSMEALPSIIDFATASELDFAEAADIASDALGSFGLDSDNLEKKMEGLKRIMDVMGLTANSTNVNVSELFETVRKGAPIAIKAGQSVETFAAVAGTLAQSGIKAEVAGTATKNLALALSGVGNQAGKTFRKLNIKLTEAGKMRDIADVFEDLSKSLEGMDDDKILQIMNAIFGKISLASAANLLGKGSGRIRKLREELEKAGGSNTRIAKFIRNDVRGSLDSMNSAIESVKISLFLMNEGPLKDTIDSMTDWIRTNEKLIATKITDFIMKIVDNFENIVTWTKRIGIGLGVFFTLSIILKSFIAIMTAVNLVMALNPVVLIVAGILLLIAAVASAIIWWDELKAAFISMPGPVKTALLVLSGPIGWFINSASILMDEWDPALGFFENLWNGIVAIFERAVEAITEIVNGIGDLVKTSIGDAVKSMTEFGDFKVGKYGLIGDFFSDEDLGENSLKSRISDAFKSFTKFRDREVGKFGLIGDFFSDEDLEDDSSKDKNGVNNPNNRFSGLISPNDRIAGSINETTSTNKSEVTIKDETGRAELTGNKTGLTLQKTGAF